MQGFCGGNVGMANGNSPGKQPANTLPSNQLSIDSPKLF
jgi:hypothetical protein